MKSIICKILSVIMLAVTAFLIYCAVTVTGSGFLGLSMMVQRIYQPHAGSENPHLSAKDRLEWYLDGEGMLEELLAEL